MNDLESARTKKLMAITNAACWLAFVFFLPAAALSPGLGSSIGMPWPLFFCTWGVMLFLAAISVIGYFVLRHRHEPVSIFYMLCPILLLINFLYVWHRYDIIQFILELRFMP